MDFPSGPSKDFAKGGQGIVDGGIEKLTHGTTKEGRAGNDQTGHLRPSSKERAESPLTDGDQFSVERLHRSGSLPRG
jgi:hypothetical protein